MDDKQFWIAIRAALLAMVAAIERRYKIGRHVEFAEADSLTPAPHYDV